ncbi:MAG TPA: hypothetical protein ACQGQH_00475 [Xylella sp.]
MRRDSCRACGAHFRARLGHCQHLEEIQIAADVAESQALYSYANQPSGSPWVEALQASVRSVITHAFFSSSLRALRKQRPQNFSAKT